MAIRKPTAGSGAKTPYKKPPLQSTAMPGKAKPTVGSGPMTPYRKPPMRPKGK